jgi:tetratricopeptide (TPR) repeat protein
MMLNRASACCLAAVLCFFSFAAYARAGGQDDSDRLAAEGRQAMQAGNYPQARDDFEQLAKLHPEVAEVHATLGAIYFKLRDYGHAVDSIHAAQKLKPGLSNLDSLLGLSLSEMNRFSEALPKLEKGFRQTADPEIRRMCGLQLLRAYTGLDRDADGVEAALELNRLFPDDPEVLYHTGRIYGNYAYLVMEKLHDKAPGSIWMLQAQGEANESAKDYDGAIVAFDHVLKLDPKRPAIHYRLGRVYLARFRDSQKPEDRDAAAREFIAELAVDPNNGNARYELAVMQEQKGNLDEARKEFESLIEIYPDFEEALVGLGGVELENQKADAAVAPLERATKIDPEDEVAWYRLAQAERVAGNRDEQRRAMDAFQKLHEAAKASTRRAGEEITPQTLGADVKSN